MAVDAKLAADLDGRLQADLARDGRLGKVRRYLRGDHDLPYMPKGAKKEYQLLAARSITNWTPLLSDTFGRSLFVDGYRPAKTSDNSGPWSYWQANGLDARQTVAHRGALEYGTSYALVLPGTVAEKRVPYWRPLSPLRSAAWYQDDDDEYPELALQMKGTTADGTRLLAIYDNQNRYTFALPKDAENWILSATDSHGLGVTPFVRFRDRLGDEASGIIRPILPLQDRVNEIVFSTLIAIQYASFRQRWATGLAIPEDEDGNPVEAFQAAVDRLWVSDNPDARFGDFAQTELSGHRGAYEDTVRTLAAVSQVSPTVMMGDLVNISAEALAAIQDSTQRKLGEYETLFGESWESGFRLAARAAGDATAAADTSAEVRWRDSEARSLSQTVDALGKISQMLSVPAEGLWERIPGITDGDIERWKALREVDPLAALTAELTRQTSSASGSFDQLTPADAAPASTAEDPSEVKAKADALGSLIRAGAVAESAAAKVGLDGVEFSGAVPVSLRLPSSEATDLEDA
jgi:hypothetical protein